VIVNPFAFEISVTLSNEGTRSNESSLEGVPTILTCGGPLNLTMFQVDLP
jgi:hypothetical protein